MVFAELPDGESHGVLAFFSPADNVAVVIAIQDCSFGKPDLFSRFIGRKAAACLRDQLLSRRKTTSNGVCQTVFSFRCGECGAKSDAGKMGESDWIGFFQPFFQNGLELVHDLSIAGRQCLGLSLYGCNWHTSLKIAYRTKLSTL